MSSAMDVLPSFIGPSAGANAGVERRTDKFFVYGWESRGSDADSFVFCSLNAFPVFFFIGTFLIALLLD